jgi:hypothetical protein
MKQPAQTPPRNPWLLLGLLAVAWAAWRYSVSRRRQWRRVAFLIDDELRGRYRESADPELGTGLFI